MNFHKLKLIFLREYITRIRTKAFIITTILAPIFIFAITVLPILLNSFSGDDQERILVKDNSGSIFMELMTIDQERYLPRPSLSIDSLNALVESKRYDGFVLIASDPEENPPQFYYKSGGLELVSSVRKDLNRAYTNYRLASRNVDPGIADIMRENAGMVSNRITESGSEKDDGLGSFIIAYVLAFSIYMALFMYGTIIMRGVLEEKTNRIVEIVISSVKPMELMIGKVLGVGFVGLTQFMIWALLFSAITIFAAPFMTLLLGDGAATANAAASGSMIPTIAPEVWLYFILYYMFGYLMYAALFAAIGSAVDSETETQQLMSPVIILMIIPMILLSKVATDPMASLSVVTSLIPLFSPVLMMTRILVADVAFWEILLSFILMTATGGLFVWIGAKIYRVGILMYGKKPSFKEIIKWMRY